MGRTLLPGSVDGSGPGFGSLLLGAVCARFGGGLTGDLLGEVMVLVHELEQDLPVAQPRLRHRLQQDRIGLTRSRQRLYGAEGNGANQSLTCDFDGSRATASQLVLGAVYAAGRADQALRYEQLRAVRRGLAWRGDTGAALFAYLLAGGRSPRPDRAAADPVGWALEVLGFDRGLDRDAEMPEQAAVRRGFRDGLRAAHPDLGAAEADAADRISELSEARRILLSL